jgi:hypothetical protein
LEEQTSRRLMDVQSVLYRQAKQTAGQLWAGVAGLVEEQNRQFSDQLSQLRLETQQALASVQSEVARVDLDLERKREIANQWLAAVESMIQFIMENYACDFFLPGRIDRIARAYDQAGNNIEIGIPETAIGVLQQQFNELSELHIDLERLHAEWQFIYYANWETASQILSMALASDFIQAVDLDGNLLPYEINVNFWSNGALQRVIDDLDRFLSRLNDPLPEDNIDVLRGWHEKLLPEIYRDFENCILDARIRAINSQLRINIADLVVQALNEQGYALETASYTAQDEREAYLARMMTSDGSEVLVKVEPAGASLGENELHVQSLDREDRTESELRQRWYEITESLSGFGLDVGRYQVDGNRPTTEIIRQEPDRKRKRARYAMRKG